MSERGAHLRDHGEHGSAYEPIKCARKRRRVGTLVTGSVLEVFQGRAPENFAGFCFQTRTARPSARRSTVRGGARGAFQGYCLLEMREKVGISGPVNVEASLLEFRT